MRTATVKGRIIINSLDSLLSTHLKDYIYWEYFTSVQNGEVYCTKLVSSPGLTKLRAINFFVLYTSVVFLSLHAIFGNNLQKKEIILASPFCYFSMHKK